MTPTLRLTDCTGQTGDHAGLPKVSIVTPSYNQGRYIRATIESVLGQDYPRIEHIVIDGGSNDETVSILKEYENKIRWVSESDNGQADAINKGIRLSSGSIVAYLNSDDIYLPGTISRVVDEFYRFPDADLVYGDFHAIDEQGNILDKIKTIPFDHAILLYDANYISQPASFYRRRLLDEIGLFDERLQYLMDYEFFLRAAKRRAVFHLMKTPLSAIRYHGDCKTLTGKAPWADERKAIREYYARMRVRHPNAMRVLSVVYRIKRYFLLIKRGRVDFLNYRLKAKQRTIASAHRSTTE